MKRFLFVCCWLSWFVLAAPAHAADPTLDELKAALKEWRHSFSTIRVVWYTWYDDLTKGIDSNTQLEGNYGGREEFTWADFGAFTYELNGVSAGQITFRQRYGNDGSRPWDAKSTEGQPDHWLEIRRWKPIPDRPLLSNKMKSAIWGLWNPTLGLWLPDALEKQTQVSLDRFEERNGVRHAVVRVNNQEYWLNPNYGWLPSYSKGVWEWIADEVKTFDSNIRFPHRGKLLLNGKLQMKWAIQEVELNVPRTRADFGPPAPNQGTTLYDHVTGNFESHGVPKQATRNAKPQAKISSTTQADGAGEIAVASSSLGMVQWLLLVVAALSLIVGIVLRSRH